MFNKIEKIQKLGEKKKIDKIIPFKNAADPEVRAAAYAAMGNINSDESVNALVTGIDDSDSKVRLAVAHALQKVGTPHEEEAVRHRVGKETDQELVTAFHDALTAMKKRE